MTLTLSKDTIQWLLEMQEKLDASIREKKGISEEVWANMNKNHGVALNVEFSEFVNECHDIWKYWKSKPIDRVKVLDEAIDVIHFYMLVQNKLGFKPEHVEAKISRMENTSKNDGLDLLDRFSESMEGGIQRATFKMATVLSTLKHYGFTEQDIVEQYKRKNAINFERLEEGY